MKASLRDYNRTPLRNPEGIMDIYDLYRAIMQPQRLGIIRLLHEQGAMNVTEIWVKLRFYDQAICSQHLAILRNAKLVTTKRIGKFVYYSLDYTTIRFINETTDLVNESMGRFQADRGVQKQGNEKKKVLE